MTPSQGRFLRALDPLLEDATITLAKDYVEPGCDKTTADLPVLFANWNKETQYNAAENKYVTLDDSMPRIARLAEKLGFDTEWSDEWTECSDCYRAFRTQANCYSWQKFYAEVAGDYVCGECLMEKPTAYLEALEGNSRNALTFGIPLDAHGYRKADMEFENGLHGGQAADPKVIASLLSKAKCNRFIFRIDCVQQFDFKFSVWIHESEFELGCNALAHGNCDGADPKTMMEMAMLDSKRQEATLVGEGAIVTTLKMDGTADTRRVSQQDIAEGKAFKK